MKPKKYPGELGRKSFRGKLYAPLLGLPANATTSESRSALADYILDEECRLLDGLLSHYKIDISREEQWFQLALALARAHVPAFSFTATRRPGRPSKNLNYLAKFIRQPAKKGRPPDVDRIEHLKFLVSFVAKTMIQEKLRGRGAQKRALEFFAEGVAGKGKTSASRIKRRYMRKWQKELSEGKRLFPEIAAKFPK